MVTVTANKTTIAKAAVVNLLNPTRLEATQTRWNDIAWHSM